MQEIRLSPSGAFDNHATTYEHLAANDYDGYRREMYRTTLAGKVPA